jgi:SAM-dependent methyltransferase
VNATDRPDEGWGYGPLSALAYDLHRPVGHSFGDVEFYAAALAGLDGPVLEPAVGNGRVLVPLLEQGLEVHGYDTSSAMLEHCHAHCDARGLRPRLFRADMAAHREDGAYAAMIVPSGSFCLLADREAARRALGHMHAGLRPGGRLLLALEPPPTGEAGADEVRTWWHGQELITLTTMRSDADPPAQRTTEWLRYELWRSGTLVRTELQIFSLLWFGMAEFTGLLHDAGFAEVRVFGDYRTEGGPEPEDGTWTFEAVRG